MEYDEVFYLLFIIYYENNYNFHLYYKILIWCEKKMYLKIKIKCHVCYILCSLL